MSEETAIVPVDMSTGEIVEHERQPVATSIDLYANASSLRLTPEESKELVKIFPEDAVWFRPDGLIYIPHTFYRERLNQVLGVGQWALIELESRFDSGENMMYFSGALFVRGCFVAKAIGEQAYIPTNKKQSYASAYEGAKSDCIVRCCKDMSIANDLWKPAYSVEMQRKYGVKVFVESYGKMVVQWRHIESKPFDYEKNVCDDSPNKPKYTKANYANKTSETEPLKQEQPKTEPPKSDIPFFDANKEADLLENCKAFPAMLSWQKKKGVILAQQSKEIQDRFVEIWKRKKAEFVKPTSESHLHETNEQDQEPLPF